MEDEPDIRTEKDGLLWTVRPGLEDLPGELSRLLSRPDRPGRAARDLKSSKLRRVRQIALDSADRSSSRLGTTGDVVVKEHTLLGPAALVRSWFLGNPATREWRILRFLHGRGVKVPEPLALGTPGRTRLPAKRAVVVLRAIPGAVTLEDILLGKAAGPAPRHDLARRAGRLICAMHDAGVRHPDLHAANLLVSPDGELNLIDFHSARICRAPLTFDARVADLIPFAGSFLVCANRTDRLRFFKAYRQTLGRPDRALSDAKKIDSAAWKRLAKFLIKHDRRPLRKGKAFMFLRIHGRKGMGEKTRRAADLGHFLGPDPEDTLFEEGVVLKKDRLSSVYSLPFAGERFVAKIYRRPGFVNALKRLLGHCRARRAWVAGHCLRTRLLPAPRPVFFLSDPIGSWRGISLIVFEEAAGLPRLDGFVKNAEPREKKRALCSLAHNLARMHNLFLANRDLKAQNILVDSGGAPVFVDPDGVRSAANISPEIMARDLMRLNASFPPRGPVSAADRIRFLNIYARARHLDSAATLALRTAIAARTLAKWSGWRRQGRSPDGSTP